MYAFIFNILNKEDDNMAFKDQKFKQWTAEEKFKIIKPVLEFIDEIVWDNNNYRPSFTLQYKNPVEYKTQLGFQ